MWFIWTCWESHLHPSLQYVVNLIHMTCKGHHFFFCFLSLQTCVEPRHSAWPGFRGGGPSVPARPPVHQHWNGSVGATQAREGGNQRRSVGGEREELPEPGPGVEHGQQVRICMSERWYCVVNSCKLYKGFSKDTGSQGIFLWFWTGVHFSEKKKKVQLWQLLYLDLQNAPPSFGSLSWQAQKCWLAVEHNTAIMWSVQISTCLSRENHSILRLSQD